MELLMFIGVAVGVGAVSGLVWFYIEQWLESRAAKKESENELLEVNQELSDVVGTNETNIQSN